jgi:hypothetical protein
MNERLKELAEQAGFDAKEIRDDESLTLYAFENFDLERFAELIRQDERERVYNILISGNCDGNVKTYIRKILEQS